VTLSLDLAHAALEAPVRLAPAVEAPMPIPISPGQPSSGRGDPHVVHRTSDGGAVEYEEVWPLAGGTIEATATRVERSGANVAARLRPGEPQSCRWRTWHRVRYVRGADDASWDCTVEAEAELTADATTFHLVERLTAKRGEAVVFEREHRSAIPRDLM
jgi:hypothetical protein